MKQESPGFSHGECQMHKLSMTYSIVFVSGPVCHATVFWMWPTSRGVVMRSAKNATMFTMLNLCTLVDGVVDFSHLGLM